jgi:hypothetical protein
MVKGLAWSKKCDNCNVAANCHRNICIREIQEDFEVKGKRRKT